MGGVPLPDIVEAYNRTIMALGRVNFHYTARIIEVWQEKQKEDGLTYSEREAQEKKKLLGERMGKPFSEKEVGYLTLLEELFKRPFTTPEILQVRQWVELEVPLTEIVRAFDETKIRTRKASFSYMAAIIKSRLESRQFTDYYNRAAEIDKLSNEKKGADKEK